MNKAILRILALAMVPFFLNGCGQSSDPNVDSLKNYKQPADTDVTSFPEYNFSSFVDSVWRIKVKLAIADVKGYNNVHSLDLLAPERFDSDHPAYNPVHNAQVITVLPVGTHLRIRRLMEDNGVWGGVRVAATLEDGTNAQQTVYVDPKLLAKNRFIWVGWTTSTNWGVDPDMLEK